MSKVVGFIAIFVFLVGCASFGELSEEEKAELEKKRAIVVAEAVNPILNLIDASIIYYEENGYWPEEDLTPGGGSMFQSHNVTSVSENEIVTDFKLTLFKINWNLRISATEEYIGEKRVYFTSLLGVSDSGNVKINMKEMKLIRGVSAMEGKEKNSMASMLFLMGDLANVEPPKRTKFTPIIEMATYLAAGLVMCTVFDIEPEQCRLN